MFVFHFTPCFFILCHGFSFHTLIWHFEPCLFICSMFLQFVQLFGILSRVHFVPCFFFSYPYLAFRAEFILCHDFFISCHASSFCAMFAYFVPCFFFISRRASSFCAMFFSFHAVLLHFVMSILFVPLFGILSRVCSFCAMFLHFVPVFDF